VATLASTRWVYDFADGARDMRALLGGKGANVAEMTRILGPGARPRRLHDHHAACAPTTSPTRPISSFGTNDLTQTALGFSRDDIESRILSRYIESTVFDRSPFETLDALGVGQLVRMGAWLGRKTQHSLKLGVCGEHAGDPDSIDFFHHSGIDYVSCSPFRVPVARVAAAQAVRAG
jgi:phosphoenolpyruvate synthase/pyruvate phosphate dikinase